MNYESRAVVRLSPSTSFSQYSLACELDGNHLEENNEDPQDFLLFVAAPRLADGVPVVLIGKDADDDALMLGVDDAKGTLRWMSFAPEEAVPWTIEMVAESTDPSCFNLCVKHEGKFQYVCVSSDDTLVLSCTNPSILMFEIVQIFGSEMETVRESDIGSLSLSDPSSHPTGEIVFSGVLMKKGDDLLGAWKKRHFIVIATASDGYRIDYFDKEGGSRKGSIECSGFQAVMSPPQQDKFGVMLVPQTKDSRKGGGSGRSRGNSSSGRTYRLRAESASSQREWLEVLVRACESDSKETPSQLDSSIENNTETEDKHCDTIETVMDTSPALTAQTLSDSARSRSRSRSRSGSTGSLTMAMSQGQPTTSSLFVCTFAAGALGMTLKRRNGGVIYIATVDEYSQASEQSLHPGDTLWSIGSRVVGNTVVDKKLWGELVALIKETPRPLEMVFQKALAVKEIAQGDLQQQDEKEGGNTVDFDGDEGGKEKLELCSSNSNYSLMDYPNSITSVTTPTTRGGGALSIQSVPSSSTGGDNDNECDNSFSSNSISHSESGVTLQSMESNEKIVTQDTTELNHLNKAVDFTEKTEDGVVDTDREILTDLSKRLSLKNFGGEAKQATASKSWRSSILGSGGGGGGTKAQGSKPTFELVQIGRRLVFEGQVLLLAKRALWQVKIPKMLYLFNDLLLVTVPAASGGDKFTVEQIIDVATCKVNCRVSGSHELVEGQIDDDKRKFLWELLSPSGSMVFMCNTQVEQQKWVYHMAHVVCDRVCEFNGSSKSSMGIGWKHQYLLGTMHAAVIQRDQSLIVILLECFSSGEIEEDELEGADEDGYTPLHYACILRLPAIVKLLQESHADVTVRDHRGLTPLHWSALQLDAASLERLCMNIMDVDLEDDKGRCPLYLACVEGRAANGLTDSSALVACVTTLLTYGSNPDRKDKEGKTALHYLSSDWQYEVVELLLEGFENPLNRHRRTNCADVNVFDDCEGLTALHFVCGANSLKRSVGEGHVILQSMLPGGNMSAASNNESKSSAGAGLRTLLILLDHGALPNMTSFVGHTPLSILSMTTSPEGEGLESSERWSDSDDAAVIMMLSSGARFNILSTESNVVTNEPPPHWRSAVMQAAIQEGISSWAGKDQLDGDVAGMRLKCYEQRKCVNAIVTSEMRQLASRNVGSPPPSSSGACPCLLCLVPFTMFRRQHHCRLCDALCCDECSRKRIVVDKSAVRICDTCYVLAKKRVDTALTEQFFAGQGAIHEGNKKKELFEGSKSQESSATTMGMAGSSIAGTMSSLSDAKVQLHERGEKLEHLADKSAKLANASNEFANMAKLLKEQNKSTSWW